MSEVGSGDSERAPAGEPVPIQGGLEPQPLNLVALNLEANVPDEQMYTWESQAAQYPPSGPPGISYVRGNVSDEVFVDCLLYRDETGELVGILNHYPVDLPPLEREGDQNIWVRPDRRRQGIGSALMTEASLRWMSFRWADDPDNVDTKLTQSGVQLVEAVVEKRSVGRVLRAPPDVVYDAWWDAEGMREWMCPRPAVPTRIEIDPRVDGQYRIDIDDAGLTLSVTGRYLAFERPRGLAFTWHCTTWEPSAPESMVVVQVEPRDEGQTLMTIRHLRLSAGLRDGYRAGWERVAAQLEEHLAGR
jgi:uncharacterized protein YndB with AHSA1/START domain